jgi:hypothetical protein
MSEYQTLVDSITDFANKIVEYLGTKEAILDVIDLHDLMINEPISRVEHGIFDQLHTLYSKAMQ